MKLALVLSILNILHCKPNFEDACHTLSQKTNLEDILVSDVLNCYRSYLLTNERKKQYIHNIENIIPLYVFRDLTKSKTIKQNKAIDLESEIKEINEKEYSTEYDFFNSIKQLFHSVNDGHFTFKVHCFEKFNFYLPIMIQPKYSKNGLSIITKINPKFKKSFFRKWKIDYENLQDQEIESIDDVPVLEYLLKLSDEVGVVKDKSTRFNNLMFSSTIFNKELRLNYGEFSAPSMLPINNAIKIKLKENDKPIVLPYIGEGELDFNSSKQYYDRFCYSSNLVYAQSEEEVELNYNLLNQNALNLKGYLKDNIPKDYTIIDSNKYFTTLTLNSNKIGIFVYPTSDISTGDELNIFQNKVHKGLLKLKELGVTKLIIDLSYNTGGPICGSLSILDYILQNENVKYTTRMRYTPLTRLLADTAKQNKPNHRVWGHLNWIDINDITYKDNKWLYPGYKLNRGNENDQFFSNYFMDRCPKSELKDSKFPFDLNNLIVLTNGICLSSCSTLLNGLLQNKDIKVIYTNGLTNPNPHNMEGGQLYIFDKIIQDLETLRLNTNPDPRIPKPFPLATQFTFTLREQYLVNGNASFSTIYNTTLPLEFQNFKPTKQIFMEDTDNALPFNLGYFWIKAANLFN